MNSINGPVHTRDYAERLREIAVEVEIPKGTRLPLDNVYYLMDGVCALTHLTKDGGESSYIFFKPGMLLGFMIPIIEHIGLDSDITRKRFQKVNHTISTKTDCRCLRMRGSVFMEFLERNPELYKLLVRSVSENLINVLALSTDKASEPASVRVCQIILDFMDDEPPHVFPRYLTYNEIAFHLSMHVITVTKIFKSLRHSGIIDKRGRTTTVIDKESLISIVNGEEELRY